MQQRAVLRNAIFRRLRDIDHEVDIAGRLSRLFEEFVYRTLCEINSGLVFFQDILGFNADLPSDKAFLSIYELGHALGRPRLRCRAG